MDPLRGSLRGALACRPGRDLYVHNIAAGFFRQRDPSLDSHVEDKRIRIVHERLRADSNPKTALVTPQATTQSVLLRNDFVAQLGLGASQFLAKT